ncbi:MAG TPA: TatD family hydrolase [Candidatus Limnocylindria bacterium]|nr:TatD family hydrolase [Candidatus Limnocylindria bacterium]
MFFCDAHNHLQDDRFVGRQDALVAEAVGAGVGRMVVNGSGEADWPAVAALAARHQQVIVPSFGCHPWYLGGRTPHWREELIRCLDATPGAVIGEIGLDRWMLENPDRWRAYLGPEDASAVPPSLADQEAAFVAQLRLATERNVAVSLHCLRAFGRLLELLEEHPRPARGFLLHSYGGPVELVAPLARLGAYFSFPGYFAHERKARQREVFRAVPPDRLLIETDAPDQLPPEALNRHPLADPVMGQPLNHPANLATIYQYLADFLVEPVESVAVRVAANFDRLFGPVTR